MHRSGTSLVSSFFAALAVDMGDRLLPADVGNPRGYFEDVDFVELHGRILTDCTEDEPGHRDWGWTESERLDRSRLPAWRDEARALVTVRAAKGRVWGWKDPRTTVLLDFWDEILTSEGGGAFYVLPYRFPWEVAESMQRTGAAGSLYHPEYAYRIWTFYNRQVLDFYRRHSERCLLVGANALLRDPARFTSLIRTKLGLEIPEVSLDQVRDRELFVTLPPADPLGRIVAVASPECARLLAELDAAADLSSEGLWDGTPPDGGRLRPAGPVDVSVVIPCFDQGEYLVEAVASVERSAPERSELVIVDDGSRQPRTLEVLEALKKAGYQVISQSNAGLAEARNRGLREARGRFILPLDADNRLLPGFLESAVAVLDAEPEVGVVYGDLRELGGRSNRVTPPEFDLDALLWANFIDACAVYRREIWETAGGYDPGVPAWEDWELWISAAERGWRFRRLPEVTFEYRVRPDSMLVMAEREGVRRPVREYVYRKHHDLYQSRFESMALAGHAEALALREDARALRASRDRLQTDIDLLSTAYHALLKEREVLLQEREALQQEIPPEIPPEVPEILRQDWDGLVGEHEGLLAERARLQEELERWRERVDAMEGTRAWRLRNLAVRMKRGLLGRRG